GKVAPTDAHVACGRALMSRVICLRQFETRNVLFRLRCRSRLCRRLRRRFGLFFLAAASRQAEDEHAKYGDKHYPVEHGILLIIKGIITASLPRSVSMCRR